LELFFMPTAKSNRYTLVLDAPTVDLLDELQLNLGLRTKAAVFDMAVNFLDWAVRQEANGFAVGRSKAGEFNQLLVPRSRGAVLTPATSPAVTA
jgi:hypothetical protein